MQSDKSCNHGTCVHQPVDKEEVAGLSLETVLLPLRRGLFCRYEAGSWPMPSILWLMTRARWPVWCRLPTMMLWRYTGSMK